MKSRDWAFIWYPDNEKKITIGEVIDYLEEIGQQCAISPIHNRDKYTQEDYDKWIRKNESIPEWIVGDLKKEHYHILLHYNGPTTFNNVNEICKQLGATIPKKIVSCGKYYKYLAHIDSEDKAKYNPEEIKRLNDFTITLSDDEILLLKIAILEDIKVNNIVEYRDLCDFYKDMGDLERLNLVSQKVNFFSKYINSKRYGNND